MISSLIPVISADHMQLASLTENEPFLPNEIILAIFSLLNLQELGNCRLIASRFITKIDDLLLKKILQYMTPFGKEEWEAYFGKIGEVPPLPSLRVFTEIYKTYMLVLLPETVDGKPLTLNFFKILAENPKGGGHDTSINIWDLIVTQHGEVANGFSKWVIFPKNILESTRGKTYTQQIQIVAQHPDVANSSSRWTIFPKSILEFIRGKIYTKQTQIVVEKKGGDYEVTHMLDAVVSLASRYVQSGERFFSNYHTRCQEVINTRAPSNLQITVGWYSPGRLDVSHYSYLDNDHDGVAAVRK